jgi:hypothetical protein
MYEKLLEIISWFKILNKWKERHVQNFKFEELISLAEIEPSTAFTAWRPRVPQFFMEAIGFGHGKVA